MNKSEIRKLILKKRKSLSAKEVENLSIKITNVFLEKIDINKFEKIAIYSSIFNEADTRFLFKELQKRKKEIFLPKIDNSSKILEFHQIDNFVNLTANSQYKNILEPNSKKDIPQLVIVPLVACDEDFYRIGMGGGFYDATIKYLKDLNPKIIFGGFSYNFQKVTKIDHEEFDQQLDFISFEDKLIATKKGFLQG